jgi:hypothetical protein
MNINIIKTIKYTILAIFAIALVGCSLTNPSYTMKISANTIQKNITSSFPVSKDLSVGKITLVDPKVMLKNNSDRMVTGLGFSYKPPFFDSIKGNLHISGNINYNKDKKAFFLVNPKIDDMKFNNSSLASMMPSNIKNTLDSVVAEVFKKYPVYTLNSKNMKNKLMQQSLKKTTIKDGKLLVTFGL